LDTIHIIWKIRCTTANNFPNRKRKSKKP